MHVKNLTVSIPFLGFRVIETDRGRVLIVRFAPLRRRFRRTFGMHVKRLHETLYLTRMLDASLYILWYRAAPNQAIHLLSSPDVHIIRSSRMRNALVRGLWAATSPLAALERALYPVARRLQRLGALGKADERRLRRWWKSGGRSRAPHRLLSRCTDASVHWAEPIPAAMKRTQLNHEMAIVPIRVELPRELEDEARGEAARLGLDPTARIVTLHVRENGWRPLMDDPRSCDVATYRPAVTELVMRGFRVVRIGDATMTPVDWPGVLDLATEPSRSDLLELWCMLNSVFFLGGDSGPSELARLVGVPMLLVNVKHVQSQYPLRRSDLFIMKRLMPTEEARIVSLRDQMRYKSGASTLSGQRRYVDNSPEEILTAVVEMLEGRHMSLPETPTQAEFRRAAGISSVLQGRIASFFVDRYLDQEEVLTGPDEPVLGRLSAERPRW